MSSGTGVEVAALAARSRAAAVLRVRGRAAAVALLPAAVAAVLWAGAATGRLTGPGWELARTLVSVLAVLVLLLAGGVALLITRAAPAQSPTVEVEERSAPDLYRLVRELAERLGVPAPSAIALTPDCDSWLEDRSHRAHLARGAAARIRPPDPAGASGAEAGDGAVPAPVLVIGSPFLWWMRVAELRALLAPVVAGTGPAAQPEIAEARRFVRGLDAAHAVAASRAHPLRRLLLGLPGRIVRVLLVRSREAASDMERYVAAASAERARSVEYGQRIVAQEQVGLAYAGWDRLLTRVALPAWRMGRWPSRLDAGVVAALTELSRRDRLADGFAARLGERPACDLLEDPGLMDEAASLLAARLFHGGPAERGPDWAPVSWQEYPREVVDRTWRRDAARLREVLGAVDGEGGSTSRTGGDASASRTAEASSRRGAATPPPLTLARVLEHLTVSDSPPAGPAAAGPPAPAGPRPGTARAAGGASPMTVLATPRADTDTEAADAECPAPEEDLEEETPAPHPRTEALAVGLVARVAREEAAVSASAPADTLQGSGADRDGADGGLPLFPLQVPRTGRELLADHVTALVCCAAVDAAGAAPALDWLDGPALLVEGERAKDLATRVRSLVEEGDSIPLRSWLARLGIRPETPVRLA